jgi:lipopolysaccharide heptosyltransferase II
MKYKIINRKKLFATIVADIVGNIIFLPRRLLGRDQAITPENIHEILVIRTAYAGDAMMTAPMLKPLKDRFTKARITFLTSSCAGEMLRGNPYIDEIIAYEPFWFYNSRKKDYIEFISSFRKRSFDLVVEARGDIRELLFMVFPLRARFKVSYGFGGGSYFLTHAVPFGDIKHRVEYHLDIARHLGCKTDSIEWGVYLTPEETNSVHEMLKSISVRKPFISVHPGGRLPLKRWITDRYAMLYDKLIEEHGMPVLLLGSKEETILSADIVKNMKNKPVVLTGKITVRELAAVLSESSLFVCNDSAPMHIAAAMKTPTVAVFGPSKSIETAPYGNISRVVEKNFPCRYKCDENVCKYERFHACMSDIEVKDVLSAVEDIFREIKI